MGSEHPGAKGNAQRRVSEIVGDGGVTTMLTLAGSFRDYRLANLVQLHRPMPDVPTRTQVAEAVGIVRAHLESGHRVWIHCQRGLDRTGAVIGGYLCQSGLAPDRVIAMLLERFPPARQQPAMRRLWQPFERLIRSFSAIGEC